ncbi:MAG: LysR family transcriptional regulator [Pseudomonadota bacterium]
MRRTLPPLNALRAFEAAGRHESFSRAAEELGVNHSAVSKHVRGLEHHLGVQLFRDLPRGVALTREGATYLATVTPAFDAIGEATEVFGSAARGTVVINAETAFAVKWLMPNVQRFYQNHPEIELEIDASRHLADISRYEADIAIRFVLSGVPDRPADLISDAWVYPYAAPDIAAQIDGDPEKLLAFRSLRDRSGEPWADWFQAYGRPDLGARLKPGKRMRAVLAHQAAVSGVGVFLGSAENVALDVAEGKLVRCFDTGFWNGSYFMMLSETAIRRKPVRLFREWLLNSTTQFRS